MPRFRLLSYTTLLVQAGIARKCRNFVSSVCSHAVSSSKTCDLYQQILKTEVGRTARHPVWLSRNLSILVDKHPEQESLAQEVTSETSVFHFHFCGLTGRHIPKCAYVESINGSESTRCEPPDLGTEGSPITFLYWSRH